MANEKLQGVSVLAEDLLTGADEIGAYLGWPRRRIYYAASNNLLPIKSIGRLLTARKSELSKALSCEHAA